MYEKKKKEEITMQEILEKANEPFDVRIKREKGDLGVNVKLNGSNIAILIGLIGVEKNIMKNSNIDEESYQALRRSIGIDMED